MDHSKPLNYIKIIYKIYARTYYNSYGYDYNSLPMACKIRK